MDTVPSNTNPTVRACVDIYDVDLAKMVARADVYLYLGNFSHNASMLRVSALGPPYWDAYCNQSSTGMHEGVARNVECRVRGTGETFPFDSHEIVIPLDTSVQMFFNRYNLTKRLSAALVEEDSWACLDDWLQPTYQSEANWPNYDSVGYLRIRRIKDYSSRRGLTALCEFGIGLVRRPELPFTQFILPILVCYTFLGSSILLSKTEERLRVYLPVFAFSPSFLFALQGYLPQRSVVSLPELLLSYLIVSTGLFGLVTVATAACKTWLKCVLDNGLAIALGLILAVVCVNLYGTKDLATARVGILAAICVVVFPLGRTLSCLLTAITKRSTDARIDQSLHEGCALNEAGKLLIACHGTREKDIRTLNSQLAGQVGPE